MTPDLKTLRSVAEAVVLAERPFENGQYGSSWQVRALSKARRAFDDAFRPQAVLSLLDRIEALEERDDLAMQIISENAKLRREAEAMAETVRTLEAERDRLENQLANIRAAANVLSWNPKTREIAERFQSLAALNPSTGAGEAG